MLINFNRRNMEKLNSKGKLQRKGVMAGTLALGLSVLLSGCNKTIFDTKYGFDKALVLGDDAAIILDVEQWKDYQGEQIQLITNNNFVLLTSSFDTNCFYGNSNEYSIEEVALGATESDEISYLTESDDKTTIFNKDLFDTKWSYNKSITFNGNNAIILPVGQWKDYEGEQLQVVSKDGLSLLLSSYNSKLVYDVNSDLKADEFAQSYVGSDGKVVDLSTNDYSGFNYDIIDTNWSYNKAIVIKENTAIILPISEWCDYEGEQIQIKIKNGPTMVTAAYDTILVNDTKSAISANDFAKSLCDKVTDLANGHLEASFFNKTIFDFNNGFSNAIFSNDNSSTVVRIKKWTDYEGEQLQVELESGDVLLSSSIMMDLISGGNSNLNASIIAKSYIDGNGKIIDKSNGNTDSPIYNKYILDFEQKFKYALKVVNGNVTIIPLKKWLDYYNDDEETTNCEQFQLILPDDTAIVTTAYDTILVNNVSNINDIAEMFRGPEGVISNLEEYVGSPKVSGWNFSWFDTKYSFKYAILTNECTSQVFPIRNWLDFKEGEQLQINFNDNSGILTSFVNTTLVDPKTEGIEEVIAEAFSGVLSKENELVKVYK